jgi:hypothetical protein
LVNFDLARFGNVEVDFSSHHLFHDFTKTCNFS